MAKTCWGRNWWQRLLCIFQMLLVVVRFSSPNQRWERERFPPYAFVFNSFSHLILRFSHSQSEGAGLTVAMKIILWNPLKGMLSFSSVVDPVLLPMREACTRDVRFLKGKCGLPRSHSMAEPSVQEPRNQKLEAVNAWMRTRTARGGLPSVNARRTPSSWSVHLITMGRVGRAAAHADMLRHQSIAKLPWL